VYFIISVFSFKTENIFISLASGPFSYTQYTKDFIYISSPSIKTIVNFPPKKFKLSEPKKKGFFYQ